MSADLYAQMMSQALGNQCGTYEQYLGHRQNTIAANQLFAQQQCTHISQGAPALAKPIEIKPKQPEKKSMFKEVTADIKAFVLEHRGVIYFIAAALILDHFFFRGAFKARLQSMADKVVTKVEEKIQ